MNMKTTAKVAMAAIILTMIGCKSKEDAGAYIGPSDIRIENGVMTPEALLSLGRISDAQLSPDGSRILYGVSYTSIEQNRSCRNLFLCHENRITGRTMLALGKSGFRTSGFYRIVYYFRMSFGRASLWRSTSLVLYCMNASDTYQIPL